MKTLRQVCAAIILSLTLTASVLAGHIETPGAPAPTPAAGSTTPTSNLASFVQTILSLVYR